MWKCEKLQMEVKFNYIGDGTNREQKKSETDIEKKS